MSQVTKVIDGGLVATLHLPRESGRRPAVIVLSGSDGGIATANMFGEPLADSREVGRQPLVAEEAHLARHPLHPQLAENHLLLGREHVRRLGVGDDGGRRAVLRGRWDTQKNGEQGEYGEGFSKHKGELRQ
jgi:hypothetical protein